MRTKKVLKNQILKIQFKIEKVNNLIEKRHELKKWKTDAILDLRYKLNLSLAASERNFIFRNSNICSITRDLITSNID